MKLICGTLELELAPLELFINSVFEKFDVETLNEIPSIVINKNHARYSEVENLIHEIKTYLEANLKKDAYKISTIQPLEQHGKKVTEVHSSVMTKDQSINFFIRFLIGCTDNVDCGKQRKCFNR